MKKFFRHKIKSLLLINKIISIHYLELKEVFKTKPEKHDFWELVFLDKGKLTCFPKGEPLYLSEGEMLFHKPDEVHSLLSDEHSSAKVLIISFECLSEAMRFFSDTRVKLNYKQKHFVDEIIKIAKKTYDITFYDSDVEYMQLLSNPTLGGEQLIKNYLEMLLIDVMRSETETEDGNDVFLQEKEINNKLAEDIIKILKSSLYSRLSIDDIALKTSYSKAYVFRQFKSATKKSVMEYYTELKVKEAKELLKKGELTIKEISEKLAFDTPNYFSKTFKKFTGKTPTEYKKRLAD